MTDPTDVLPPLIKAKLPVFGVVAGLYVALFLYRRFSLGRQGSLERALVNKGAFRQLDPEAYRCFSDLYLPRAEGDGLTQVCHAVVSPFGIFVIETKRQTGAIHGAEHQVIPDRIEAGTFLYAAAITGGDILVRKMEPSHLNAVIDKLHQAGVRVEKFKNSARVRKSGRLKPVDITTLPYPAFPTDLQAQYMALMTQAEGIAIVVETIFENRFMHAPELARMGANIRIDGKQAIVAGPRPLTGAGVIASDLRASASLVLGALVASGETVIDRVYHIDRGYEKIEAKLAAVGARIRRAE